MSKLTPGKYIIINRVNSLTGKDLAVNFDGENTVVTVVDQDLQNLPTQVWIVKDYKGGNTQTISPQNRPDLQIGLPNNIVKIVSGENSHWFIQESGGVTTVQSAGLKGFWGLKHASNKEQVTFEAGTGGEKQNWLFIPA